MGVSQAPKFIFLCHWLMHFPRCNQLDFQIVTIENEGPSVFRIELAKHYKMGMVPALMVIKKLLGEV